MIESKQCHIQQFLPVLVECSIIELIQDLMGIYIVAKFGTDWSIFADARVLTKSNMANFLIQGQITWTVLVRLVPL